MQTLLNRSASFIKQRRLIGSLLIVALVAFYAGSGLFQPRTAQAASLTALSDTMSILQISTSSSHVIKFTTPSGASSTNATIVVTFPSDFNFTSKATGTISMTYGASTGLENSATFSASPGTNIFGIALSGTQQRILTITTPNNGGGSSPITPGNKVIINYDSTNSVNPTSSSNYAISINGSFGDTGTITVPILTIDQVSVSATVNQSLTFTISTTTIAFGALNSGASTYAASSTNGSASEVEAHNLVIGTNAATGYTATVRGGTLADTTGHSILAIGGTNTAPQTGTEQFGLRMTAAGGSGTVTAPYAASGFAFAATTSTASQVSSATVATANTTYSARYLANISATTTAGLYTTALTYVATANY